MSTPENIVRQDNHITTLLGTAHPRDRAAQELFEHYRLSGENKDAFVAALIARLCLLHKIQQIPSIGATP